MINGMKYQTYDLSRAQRRIWFDEKMNGFSLNNIGGYIVFNKEINAEILNKAINLFIKSNDALRLNIVDNDMNPMQYMKEFEYQEFEYFDLSNEENPFNTFTNDIRLKMEKPIQLTDNRLYYFSIYKVNENQTCLFGKFHHIISDGWSLYLLQKEILRNYDNLVNHIPIDTIENIDSYVRYIKEEQIYLNSNAYKKSKKFWDSRYEGLVFSSQRFIFKSADSEMKGFNIEKNLYDSINRYCNNLHISVNTFFIYLYFIYQLKTTQIPDCIVGLPVYNRVGRLNKALFGMCTSTVPLRFCIDKTNVIKESILKMNDELIQCYKNQRYPYEDIVRNIDIEGNKMIFDTYINCYNMPIENDNKEELINELFCNKQNYPLQIIIKDWKNHYGIEVEYHYNKECYNHIDIETMHSYLMNIANEIICDSLKEIRQIKMLSDEKYLDIIYTRNKTLCDYRSEKTIIQLIEEAVEENKERIALNFKNETITYDKMNKKANQLARFLNKYNVKKGDYIGMLLEHSIDTFIGILAVLKLGCTYVPIDCKYPSERIEYILKNTMIQYVLTNCNKTLNGPISIHIDQEPYIKEESTNLQITHNSKDIAYIIYTSGSTGTPKGVMVENQGLVNYICWAYKSYVKNKNQAFAFYSSLSFDLTVTSIFTPLIGGNPVIIYRDDKQEHVLYRIFKENKVNILKLTPAHLSLIKNLDNSESKIDSLIVGGEDLKVDLAKKVVGSFGRNIDIFNEYGPTETTVGCMIHKYDVITDTDISVPIGVPADNVFIYILDKHLMPVADGEIGEIYISGDGLARGYLNKPEITKERFITNPFMSNYRMYKTGDLARWLYRGVIEYKGRCDSQVNFHGFRIELKEIEETVLSYNGIKDVVVQVIQSEKISMKLCAYVVTEKNIDIAKESLEQYLYTKLPEYMVPRHYMFLEHIPLTNNGKVDFTALQPPVKEHKKSQLTGRTELENIILRVWKEILESNEIGIDDNFYEIGGDSIKAIQIVSKLSGYGVKVSTKDVLNLKTIQNIAKRAIYSFSEKVTFEQGNVQGETNLTPIAEWFFEQKFNHPNQYIHAISLKMLHQYDSETYNTIYNKLLLTFDGLRINYSSEKHCFFYNEEYLLKNQEIESFIMEEGVEVSDYMQLISKSIAEKLDIEQNILFRFVLVDDHKTQYILLLAHHLIIDGVSWKIILDYLYDEIKSMEKPNEEIPFTKTASLYDWNKKITSYIQDEDLDKDIWFWNEVVNSMKEIPGAKNQKDWQSGNAKIYQLKLEDKMTMNVKLAADTMECSVYELLLTILKETVSRYFNKQTIVMELENNGRYLDIDTSNSVGWFTAMYPVIFRNKEKDSIDLQIKDVKDSIHAVPHNGLSYHILKFIVNDSKLNDYLVPEMRFNYLGFFGKEVNNDLFKLEDYFTVYNIFDDERTTAKLDINVVMFENNMQIICYYNEKVYTEEEINNFTNCFIKIMNEITELSHTKDNDSIAEEFSLGGLNNEDLFSIIE